MPKYFKIQEDQEKDKLEDLIIQINFIAQKAFPHFKAIKIIEAEIEVAKLKIRHHIEKYFPEIENYASFSHHYDEKTKEITFEALTKREDLISKMPDGMPNDIKEDLADTILNKGM